MGAWGRNTPKSFSLISRLSFPACTGPPPGAPCPHGGCRRQDRRNGTVAGPLRPPLRVGSDLRAPLPHRHVYGRRAGVAPPAAGRFSRSALHLCPNLGRGTPLCRWPCAPGPWPGRPGGAVSAQCADLCAGLLRRADGGRGGGKFLAALHRRGTGSAGGGFGHAADGHARFARAAAQGGGGAAQFRVGVVGGGPAGHHAAIGQGRCAAAIRPFTTLAPAERGGGDKLGRCAGPGRTGPRGGGS